MSEDNFNRYCEQMLVQYKRRNTKTVTRHLKSVCDILSHEDDHVVQTKFGGSVQKGTYVTGLSDVDVLLIVNQSSLKKSPPSKVIAYVRDTIEQGFPENRVTAGKLAVTITYADKIELEILPAIKTVDGFRIADHGSRKWSGVIHPDRFVDRLIRVNNACGGRVVPTIKLLKALANCFIRDSSRRTSGYHMESLAVDAFAGYEGKLDRVWGKKADDDVRPIRVMMTKLRRKLGDDADNPTYVFTEPRVGYRMPKGEKRREEG